MSAREAPCSFDALVREEHLIDGPAPDVKLFVMRIAAPHRRGTVMLTHGAGSASSASWDFRVRDYSLMRALACAGFEAYAVDIRGFGGSTLPDALKHPAEDARPAVRLTDAIEDLHAAILFATKTSSIAELDLIGWSWGSDVAGAYAAAHPERVRRLVLMSPVYDRRWPARHQTARAWYPLSKHELDKLYDPAREEREVWDEFVRSLFRFTEGDTLRLPNGPYADIYGEDAPLWNARAIRASTLILRGDRDPAALDEHARRLFEHLEHAAQKRYLVLGHTGHFLYRERHHREVQSILVEFLGADQSE